MKLPATAAAALSLVLVSAATAQTTFADPANLRGERVSPKTGLELPIDQGVLGLQEMLRRLNTRASLMLIVAHPDDEDGGMLTALSRGLGARVATLTLTRGEGGQNAMTGDFEDALGLIRTQELLAADRYFGADQMFGTEVDFGFSKTKEEAFRKWTHERVLYDAVRAVRLYRPLVIAAVFVGGVTDGHGQHQVSGEIAQEVFKAAADPNVFPELTREGILPWAPLKVYARVPSFAITSKGLFDYATNQYVPASFTNYVTGQTSSTPPTPDVIIHEGATDPLLTSAAANPKDVAHLTTGPEEQLSYVQFARIGLGLQRTQIGPGVRSAHAGTYDVAYHRYGSRLPVQRAQESSFFEGVDTRLEAVAGLSKQPPLELTQGLQSLATSIRAATAALDVRHPEAIAPTLVEAQHKLGALLDSLEHKHFSGREDVLHELRVKQVQLNDALVLALGLQFHAKTGGEHFNVTEGTNLTVQTSLTAGSPEAVGVFAEALQGGQDHRSERLLAIDREPEVAMAKPLEQALKTIPAQTRVPTRPYFYRTNPEQSVYLLRNPALRNAPATPPALTAWATLRYRQTEIQLGHVVDAADQALLVVPPVSVMLPSGAAAFPEKQSSVLVSVNVTPPGTRVEASLPSDWALTPDTSSHSAGSGAKLLKVQAPAPLKQPFTLKMHAVDAEGHSYNEGFRPVGYPGIPFTNTYADATLRLVPVNLNLPKNRTVGYLAGTGDAVADNLRSVGFAVSELTVADLTPDVLSRFGTVILGVRTYNAHPDLHGAPTAALLEYARSGGNVIVQYQTAEFTGADAPYPLTLGGNAEKVVDETAPVRLLTPGAPALSYPNQITEADFHGWVEERGHGFLQTWDPHYTALTETHDPGAPAEHVAPQLPQDGGLVTTQYGRGHWTYLAFALYRQLPNAVPGSLRLFSNVIGLADAPARTSH